jgi:hypothetical protein
LTGVGVSVTMGRAPGDQLPMAGTSVATRVGGGMRVEVGWEATAAEGVHVDGRAPAGQRRLGWGDRSRGKRCRWL